MSKPVAIVTGAGKGIGRAVAGELASRGYALSLVSRTKSDLHSAQKELPGCAIFACDVSDPQSAEDVVRGTLDAFGRVDALVNNAGAAPVLSVRQTTPDEWRRVIDTNLSSAFYFSRAVWASFEAQKSGVIVNVSSLAARDPFPGFSAYSAAKGGLNSLSLALSREGAEHNIRVHVVAPGAVETGMFRAILDESQFPRHMTLDPQDAARVVVDCVAGSLRYTSGEVIWIRRQPIMPGT